MNSDGHSWSYRQRSVPGPKATTKYEAGFSPGLVMPCSFEQTKARESSNVRRNYSCRNATIGSTRIARRAGM